MAFIFLSWKPSLSLRPLLARAYTRTDIEYVLSKDTTEFPGPGCQVTWGGHPTPSQRFAPAWAQGIQELSHPSGPRPDLPAFCLHWTLTPPRLASVGFLCHSLPTPSFRPSLCLPPRRPSMVPPSPDQPQGLWGRAAWLFPPSASPSTSGGLLGHSAPLSGQLLHSLMSPPGVWSQRAGTRGGN